MKKTLILLITLAVSAFSQPCFPPFLPNTEHPTGSQVSFLGENGNVFFLAAYSSRLTIKADGV